MRETFEGDGGANGFVHAGISFFIYFDQISEYDYYIMGLYPDKFKYTYF